LLGLLDLDESGKHGKRVNLGDLLRAWWALPPTSWENDGTIGCGLLGNGLSLA
jgi:hypothetical protein